MVKESSIIKKSTRGVTKDTQQIPNSSDTFAQTLLPDFNIDEALMIISTDDTVRSAIISLVDKAIEAGFTVTGEDGKSRISDYDVLNHKIRFERFYYDLLVQMFSYQNAYVEIVKDGNNDVKFLNLLEVSYTEPVKNEKDDVTGYKQTVTRQSDGDFPKWDKDEVSHFRLNKYDSSVWSGVDIKALYKWVLIKQYIQKYIAWLFGTNQFRNVLSFKDGSSDVVDSFMTYYKAAQKDLEKPLAIEGEIDNLILRTFSDGMSILSWVDKCDSNINKVMQVPPIISGETGNSNRSSGDKQDQVMATRIRSVQKQIKESMDYDLFPKMGYPKWRFMPNPVLKNDVTKILENVEKMRNNGFKEEKIIEYLEYEGFPVSGDLFDPQPVETESTTEKSDSEYPSRKKKPEDEMSKEIGTGEDSTTREDQLVAKGDRYNWVVEQNE